MFCSEVVVSFACGYFVVTGRFVPFSGLSILRANLASTVKSAAGKVGLFTSLYVGCTKWFEKSEHLPPITSTQDIPISL